MTARQPKKAKPVKPIRDWVKESARAHSDLSIFYAVIALMEGGLISSDYDRESQNIVSICQNAAQTALEKYYRALEEIASRYAPGCQED